MLTSHRTLLPFLLLLLVTSLLLTCHNSWRNPLPSPYAYPPTRVASIETAPGPAESTVAQFETASSTLVSSSTITTEVPDPQEFSTNLVSRLRTLVARPIPSYDVSLELEAARCPTTHLQSNQDQLRGQAENWAAFTSLELRDERQEVVRRALAAFGFASEDGNAGLEDEGGVMKGTGLPLEEWKRLFGNGERGLVFTAGNKDTTRRLLTTIRILRKHHGCTLPIEIWGFPHELNAMGSVRTELEEMDNIVFREITSEPVAGAWKQFQIKAEAIAKSDFSEVLYLDSDNVPLRDPTFLFDAPLYKENGIVLWPDFNKDGAANPIWRMSETPCNPREFQVETGQLLVSKTARGGANMLALELARAMQARHEFWFKLSGGDKDTFRYAYYFLDLPYSPAPYWLASAGTSMPSHEGHTFCGTTMLQFGLSSTEWRDLGSLDDGYLFPEHAPPLFAHLNLLKHSGYNNARGSTFQSIKLASDGRIQQSTLLLHDIRQTGLNVRGICSDLWDAKGAAKEGRAGSAGSATEGAYETGRVEVVSWKDSWGGMLRGFEDLYYDEGGVAGAW